MAKSLSLKTADAIRARMKADAGYAPASIAHVKSEYKVSASTACAAVRILVNEGLLASTRGKGIRRAGVPHEGPADALFREMCACIQDGVWRGGERLPKFDQLTDRFAVSRTTLSSAIDRLSRELFIHKRGMTWIVGPRPPDPGKQEFGVPSTAGQLALLICGTSAENPAASLWLLPFMEPLSATLREKGIEAKYADRADDPIMRKSAIPSQGPDSIGRTIRACGDRYRGAIILDRFMDADALHAWYSVLSCARKRPVVLFDSSGDRQNLTRSELGLDSRYFLLYLDEEGAVDLALRSLAAFGHRTIGLPEPVWLDAPWVNNRLRLVRRRAGVIAPAIRVLDAPLNEPFFAKGSNAAVGSYVSLDFSEMMDQWARSLRHDPRGKKIASRAGPQEIRRGTASLTSLIDRGATALLCLNDNLARLCYFWSCAAGLRVPEDISILSFDNHREHQRISLATIDFGFSRLGYLAGRILCGAVPSEAGRNGSIPGICTLVNRGSLGEFNARTTGRMRPHAVRH
jgi:hypothetical protein